MDELQLGISYVVLTFEDNSKQIICTTLNKEIMKKLGVDLKEEHFYDLRKQRYIKFNRSADKIEIMDSVSEVEEVSRFADKFI